MLWRPILTRNVSYCTRMGPPTIDEIEMVVRALVFSPRKSIRSVDATVKMAMRRSARASALARRDELLLTGRSGPRVRSRTHDLMDIPRRPIVGPLLTVAERMTSWPWSRSARCALGKSTSPTALMLLKCDAFDEYVSRGCRSLCSSKREARNVLSPYVSVVDR